jgi:hypothetical protein
MGGGGGGRGGDEEATDLSASAGQSENLSYGVGWWGGVGGWGGGIDFIAGWEPWPQEECSHGGGGDGFRLLACVGRPAWKLGKGKER